ncbi:uncharacterized protein LOC126235138 [Schistocerca nitens]|uniref:uncharacterized protein LOC126235138 n=1 Tax=Schistocerca nitens TaxID=7011 RepID=UPI0021193BD1|nr:uncharacterized protein LOC126235138 [Schistocerca nitens]
MLPNGKELICDIAGDMIHPYVSQQLQQMSDDWVSKLPLVLLGRRSHIIPQVNTSPVEMAYGLAVSLPGAFLNEQKLVTDTPTFIFKLKEQMRSLRPVPTEHHDHKIFIHQQLMTSEFIFIQHDAVRTPLQPTYDGPYLVLSCNDKHFKVEMPTGKQTISIDRLKPAFLLTGYSTWKTQQETPFWIFHHISFQRLSTFRRQ